MFDILAIGAHPDDIEIFMGGAILKLKDAKFKIMVCDLSTGEAGTFGSVETREKELNKASQLMKIDMRVSLNIADGNIRNSSENRLKVIEIIRKYKPKLVFTFADSVKRHPDHYYCNKIVKESCYLSGLSKIITKNKEYRPENLIYFPELNFNNPDFIIDITDYWETKVDLIKCYASQVKLDKDHNNGTTFLKSKSFWEILEARAVVAGALIGVRYGEPFFCTHPPKIENPLKAFRRKLR